MHLDYYVATTADGFIADSGGGFGFFPPAEDSANEYLAALRGYSHVLMGRKTYEVGLPHGVTNPYPFLSSHVFSMTMKESPDPAVELVSGDPVAFVTELKKREGNGIYLCGGGALAGTLLRAGLVDNIIVKQHPVVIGHGTPLLVALDGPVQLTLEKHRIHPSGVAVLHYSVRHEAVLHEAGR